MVYGLNDLTYEQTIRRFSITTLETRRIRGDLIEVFKILKSFDKVDYPEIFYLSTTG